MSGARSSTRGSGAGPSEWSRTGSCIPFARDLDLEGRFLQAATPVLDRLMTALTGANVSAVLADGQARVVQRRGGDAKLGARLDGVQFAPGFGFAEQIAGTNGIGTALAGRRPCYIVGREHFADCMQPFACAGAPIRNPLSGRVEGILDLTCLRRDADPAMLELVREACSSIEGRLLEQATERERVLLAAYLRAGRHDPAASNGRPQNGPADHRFRNGKDRIDRIDQAVLRSKAEELIASPHRTLDEVVLSGGRVATLLRRSVTGPGGEEGLVVEARILAGPRLRHVALTGPALTAPTLGSPGMMPGPIPATAAGAAASSPTSVLTSATAPVSAPPSAEADSESGIGSWLLLVGEPGVGRLALLARQRLELLHDASVRIGTTLDVTRTAEELTEVSVPRFADFAAVDLPDSVLRGDEPESVGAEYALRRVAMGAVHQGSCLYAVGDPVRYLPSTPQARCLESEQSVLEPALAEADGWFAQEPARTEKVLAAGIHSLITVPIRARGVTLGVVSFYRSEKSAPFEDDDLPLAQELVTRAAICIDNARRFTREHNTALALQRSLLPRGLPEQNAVEVAYRYLPAQSDVGGDWFDVIPLSGARVALVVGDVVGHGVHAAATMGRLRTAVHNFCSLDLPPDDLLTHLDDLVGRLDRSEDPTGEDSHQDAGIVGATCLYVVYDPVSCHCSLTRAGHPVPAIVRPGGIVDFPDLPSGPPLGLGGMPFETVELELPEGSQLVLFTDGLIEDRHHDIDVGLEKLRNVLTCTGRPPEETCEAVLDTLLPLRPSDDVALLVARTNALDCEHVAQWELPTDPAAVSRVRAAVTRQLAYWDLEELAFTTELIASELVTNAIRHGTGPVQLRLLRDRALICEVSDGSSTSPRLRRARTMDEGGRGLFLVAQLTQRWGTRYTTTGKIIWTEQNLP